VRPADIYFHKEGGKLRLPNTHILSRWIERVVKMEGRDLGPLTFIYCSDEYLRAINSKYLKINKITDVIAFEYNEDTMVSGDIFIGVGRVRENASYYKIPFQAELKRVMVHGLLHLIGYGDKTAKDKSAMTEKEDLYLSLHSQ